MRPHTSVVLLSLALTGLLLTACDATVGGPGTTAAPQATTTTTTVDETASTGNSVTSSTAPESEPAE